MKCSNSGAMSSARARSGGTRISTVLMRYSRSSRNSRARASSGERLVGGGYEAHVDGDGAVAAERRHGALLERGQELALQVQRQVADLVEEQRAARRGLEAARAILARVRERAFAMAEQLALEQRLAHCAEVHGHEHLAGALRLTRAAGARRALCRRRSLRGSARSRRSAPRGARARTRRASTGALPITGCGAPVAASTSSRSRVRRRATSSRESRSVRPRGYRRDQLLVLPRLQHEVGGARLDRVHRRRHVAVGGHQHHDEARIDLEDLPQPREAFGAAVRAAREVHVEQHDVEARCARGRAACAGRTRFERPRSAA